MKWLIKCNGFELYWFRLTVLLFSSALVRVFIVVLFAYSFAGSIVIWWSVCYLFGYSGFLSNCLALGYSWASSKHIKCAWRVWYALIEAKRRLAPRTRNVPTLWSCVSLKNVLFDHVCLFFVRPEDRTLWSCLSLLHSSYPGAFWYDEWTAPGAWRTYSLIGCV